MACCRLLQRTYGFTKPYSEDTAKLIDKEVSRLIAEQYDRAKKILTEKAEGHHALTSILLDREVIYTEDVENIFGKRQWSSRTEEIMAAEEEKKAEIAGEETKALECKKEECEKSEEKCENNTTDIVNDKE